jgi:hypothetical protein
MVLMPLSMPSTENPEAVIILAPDTMGAWRAEQHTSAPHLEQQ